MSCVNCGECCTIVRVNDDELKKIAQYLISLPNEELKRHRDNIKRRVPAAMLCDFRDVEKQQCLIYPVRPPQCVLTGVEVGFNCNRNLEHDEETHKAEVDMSIKRFVLHETGIFRGDEDVKSEIDILLDKLFLKKDGEQNDTFNMCL